MAITVTTKGQVTIPKPIRDLLGLKAGSEIEFVRNSDGEIVLKPAKKSSKISRSSKFRGHAKKAIGNGMSTDDILALTSGDN
jgi:antitoxin PrlF